MAYPLQNFFWLILNNLWKKFHFAFLNIFFLFVDPPPAYDSKLYDKATGLPVPENLQKSLLTNQAVSVENE